MADDQKPIRPERVHTLCLDFSSFSMEPYINNLLKKMQKVIPTFRVNVAYKSISISSLFFTDSKAATPPHETSNVCYEFTCECKNSYIGHTARPRVSTRMSPNACRAFNVPQLVRQHKT